MGDTYVLSKEEFIELMNKSIKSSEMVVFSTILHGNLTACSKKINAKRMSIAFAGDAFKKPDTISDILGSIVGGILIINKNHIHTKHITKEGKT